LRGTSNPKSAPTSLHPHTHTHTRACRHTNTHVDNLTMSRFQGKRLGRLFALEQTREK